MSIPGNLVKASVYLEVEGHINMELIFILIKKLNALLKNRESTENGFS
jgi:hypothetical protein